MLCMWPPQRKCMAHAIMPKRPSTSCPLQSHQWIPHPPITIPHTSPHVIHYHWLPPTMALWQLTHHSTAYQQQWPKCQPPLTHQWSIQGPKYHWMGPLPLRPNHFSVVMSNCLLLPRETTRTLLQPSNVGKENHWPSVDHVSNHLAMLQWRTIWKRLWRTMIYSPPNNTWQRMSHLWENQRQWQPQTHNHTALATNQGSLEVDEMSPRCIPSNGQSVPGTKHWPRLTLQDSWVTTGVVAITRRCMVWQHYIYINQHLW
jgi:hypothetical protein